MLVAAAITKEDSRTFEFIFDFVLTVCPQLSAVFFVLLLDGDWATWLAARNKFQRVWYLIIFILCDMTKCVLSHMNLCIHYNKTGCRHHVIISCLKESEKKVWSSSPSTQRRREILFFIFNLLNCKRLDDSYDCIEHIPSS